MFPLILAMKSAVPAYPCVRDQTVTSDSMNSGRIVIMKLMNWSTNFSTSLSHSGYGWPVDQHSISLWTSVPRVAVFSVYTLYALLISSTRSAGGVLLSRYQFASACSAAIFAAHGISAGFGIPFLMIVVTDGTT